jgi:Zn-dependent M28 family amino/carboxypeptidase
MRPVRHVVLLLVSAAPLLAQGPAAGTTLRLPAAASRIRESDLRRDLFLLAGPGMRGREAGTPDELRASMWLAERMRGIGLVPFGADSSWFQWFDMRRTVVSTAASSVRLGDRPLALWSDITPTSAAAGDASDVPLVVRDVGDTTVDVRGRIVVAFIVPPPAANIRTTTNTWAVNYIRAAITAQAVPLQRRGAAAVVLIVDSVAETGFAGIASVSSRGAYDVVGGAPRFVRPPRPGAAPAAPPRPVPVLLARGALAPELTAPGATLDIRIRAAVFETPSVNIIGLVRGTDPVLRDEYVVFSSHQDHDGVRYPVNGDTVWAGADDNGSTSVALLAIARAWVRQPAKRSALFIFHGAEERGLLGSRYHAVHPVVPLERMVAVLNGDMIGRNHPDTAALMGTQPPHRNSSDLVQMATLANAATARFVIDSTWDRPDHPEGWYFRSDHVPYAERGVPALFFSTNLHPDYHTPRDTPERINYPKLTRMTLWMYMTGWLAANADRRLAVDSGFALR